MVIAATIISTLPGYFKAMPCQQIASMGGDSSIYPACVADTDGQTVVEAKFVGATNVETIAASFELTFGMAGWIGLVLHFIGAEIYLRLTPAEDERLRRVSYERQLERGFSHPGSAGLTVDRFGDAHPWTPPDELQLKKEKSSSSLAHSDRSLDADSNGAAGSSAGKEERR